MAVLLQLNNIRKEYGARAILEDASASFNEFQKIGVVGRNGAGKSTLCRIIIGQEEPDGGTLTFNNAMRLSYLEQHDPYKPQDNVLDFLMRYTGKEEWECGEVAGRFQLKSQSLAAKIGELAGGYQTRVKLTAMLLRDPNFLILDEPSNYLDLSTLILLENFLQEFNGGYLIVSHDREFLKRTCEHTLEVEHGGVFLYPGNIEEYFEFKEEQLRQKLAHNKTVEKKRDQLQDFIDRFRAKASTATRAKSKMKQLSKLKTIEIAHATAAVRITIPPVEKKGGVALSCSDLEIGYEDKRVASGIHLDIDRGSHVAVLGDNGQGKTTFLRTIAGNLKARTGSYKWGTALEVGYYAQHVFSTLHPDDDVYGHLQREAAEDVKRQDILDMAAAFLFQGDDVRKKTAVLSGGERARLCLAGLLLSEKQVLLLDEPTNHLDFETVEALGKALGGYEGTIFFISHDRTFVNLIATTVIDIKDGKIKRYPGTYEDYVYHLECAARGEEPGELSKRESVTSENGTASRKKETDPEKQQDIARRKKAKSDFAKLKRKINQAEHRIEHWTKERDALFEESRNNPFHYSRKRRDRSKQLTIWIEEEEAGWLRMLEDLDRLKKQLAQR
ncbi:MAG: ABC-F family ATP-binding cassette domain-containing protein [Candidatus Omnitrophota bacterium]|nr:ABC-F family ATP-binding cassette domain-containing protein [Candidatus Omnitrophota bacterium]